MGGIGMTDIDRKEFNTALTNPDLADRLVVTPLLDPDQVGAGTIDLRLGTEFLALRRTRRSGIDPAVRTQAELDEMQDRVVVPFGERLWLHPRHFILATTLEFITIPRHLCATVVGRSSWGRLGLIVATAVFVHPGYHGCLTLELVNAGDSPIALTPGSRIAQLSVAQSLEAAPDNSHRSEKYHAPVRPEASKLPSDRTEFDRLRSLGHELRSRLG
jgi:dCTP deaminase